MKFLNKLLATIVFGVIGFMAILPFSASFENSDVGLLIGLSAFIIIGILCFFVPTSRRAWGRGSLLAGALFFALPLSSTFLGARAFTQTVAGSEDAATNLGAGAGVGLFVGVSAFIGFIIGTILLILGLILVLGGRREVVVISRREGSL